MSTLETPHVELRTLEPTPANAAVVARLAQENYKHLRRYQPWVLDRDTMNPLNDESALELLKRQQYRRQEKDKFSYYIFAENKIVGGIEVYNWKETKSMELSCWVCKDETQKGYMSAAIAVIERVAFQQKIYQIEARIDPENYASIGLARKMGYIQQKQFEDDFSACVKGEYLPEFSLLFVKTPEMYRAQNDLCFDQKVAKKPKGNINFQSVLEHH